MTFRHAVLPLLALPLALSVAGAARGAEAYDNCAGTITTLPTTITTQGVWCLKGDLSTSLSSGAAITVAANNVTIDCNGFKVGGLQAGIGTAAYGISIPDRSNAVVRDCNVRGFYIGLRAAGGDGHRFEDNVIVGSTYIGILSTGQGSLVRGNRIIDSGGSTFTTSAGYAVAVSNGASVLDNDIAGVTSASGGDVFGISSVINSGATIGGNRIGGIVPAGVGSEGFGISNSLGTVVIEGNAIVGFNLTATVGVKCSNSDGTSVRNIVAGLSSGVVGCHSTGDVFNP